MQMWTEHEYDFWPEIIDILNRNKIHQWLECGNFGQAPTGEPYLTLVSGGIKPEGEPAYYYESKAHAIRSWMEFFEALCRHAIPGSILYWRRKPFLAEIERKFSVFSRLLISDKPKIQEADYNNNPKEEV